MKSFFKSRRVFFMIMVLLSITVASLALAGCVNWTGSYHYYTTWEDWGTDADCSPTTHVTTYNYQGEIYMTQIPAIRIAFGHFTVTEIPGYSIPFVGTVGSLSLDCGYPFHTEFTFTEDSTRIEAEFNLCGGVHADSFNIRNFSLDNNKPNQIFVYENNECMGMAKFTSLSAQRFTVKTATDASARQALDEVMQQAKEMGIEFAPDVYEIYEQYSQS
ncbi:hypothetical protein ACFLU3_03270 [Chloroflexota bacterium]